MSTESSIIYDLDEISDLAKKLKQELVDQRIWVFEGQMGAGKTTLIKEVAKAFGIQDPVSSPTFGIVNEYSNRAGEKFHHFDFYRVEDPAEALDIGIDEYFYGGDYCWLEWAGKIEGHLPDEFVLLTLTDYGKAKRRLIIERIKDGE